MKIYIALAKELPDFVKESFVKLGQQQHGKPEEAMRQVQIVSGGGQIAFLVEHIGDLLHRMTYMVGWEEQSTGHSYIVNKLKKTLAILNQPLTQLRRDFQLEEKHNSEYQGIPLSEYQKRLTQALKTYAWQQAKLPAYNRVHWLARQAAICLGEQRFKLAAKYLNQLKLISKDKGIWELSSTSFKLVNGQLKNFPPQLNF